MDTILSILGSIGDTITSCVNFIGNIINFITKYINAIPNDFKIIILTILAFGIAILIYRFVR